MNFPIKLALRLDWSEMDMFGHINNVSFFKYIQAARVNYWEQVGIAQLFQENQVGIMLASSACQFRKPLFYPGNITIESGMAYIKNTSFSIHQRILDHNNELSAEAQDVILLYNFKDNTKVVFPSHIRQTIAQLEGREL